MKQMCFTRWAVASVTSSRVMKARIVFMKSVADTSMASSFVPDAQWTVSTYSGSTVKKDGEHTERNHDDGRRPAQVCNLVWTIVIPRECLAGEFTVR